MQTSPSEQSHSITTMRKRYSSVFVPSVLSLCRYLRWCFWSVLLRGRWRWMRDSLKFDHLIFWSSKLFTIQYPQSCNLFSSSSLPFSQTLRPSKLVVIQSRSISFRTWLILPWKNMLETISRAQSHFWWLDDLTTWRFDDLTTIKRKNTRYEKEWVLKIMRWRWK